MADPKIRCCPFCESEVSVEKEQVDAQTVVFVFSCSGCDLTAYFDFIQDEAEAIETWNDRVDGITRCKCCHHWKYVSDGLGDCHHPRFAIPGQPAPTMRPEEFCALGEPREEARK